MFTYILRLTMPRSSDDVLPVLSSCGPIFVCSNLHKQTIFMALQWAILSGGHIMQLFSDGDSPIAIHIYVYRYITMHIMCISMKFLHILKCAAL